jgi:hypothetical protein
MTLIVLNAEPARLLPADLEWPFEQRADLQQCSSFRRERVLLSAADGAPEQPVLKEMQLQLR